MVTPGSMVPHPQSTTDWAVLYAFSEKTPCISGTSMVQTCAVRGTTCALKALAEGASLPTCAPHSGFNPPGGEDESGPVASCPSAHAGARGHMQSTPGAQQEETSKESPGDGETMLSQDPALPADSLLCGSTMLLEPRLWGLWLLLPPGLPSTAV